MQHFTRSHDVRILKGPSFLLLQHLLQQMKPNRTGKKASAGQM
jgi:hypothetical protein